MRMSDLPDVLTVEHQGYRYPWSKGIFEDCLRVGYCCLVAELDGAVAGHGLMMAQMDEAHILNVCVSPDARRRGVAWTLLHALLEVGGDAGVHAAFLEVRRSNRAAIALYEAAGFIRIGWRKDYYPAPFGREHAVVMSRDLPVA
ncbi:MAG: ribosomal protein S18-alanine N-acetyltransferase [Halofilum sp. (in: g-proteobacteria)]